MDIGIHNETGKLIIKMKDIIKKLSKLELADSDCEDDQNEIENFKNLIIESRNIVDDSYFEFVIGDN